MEYNNDDYLKLYNLASNKSFWRGYRYYKQGNAKKVEIISETEIKGIVKSDSGNEYEVHLNLAHPRLSECTCPFTEGNSKICKHMVALYFAAYPTEIKVFDEEVEDVERRTQEKENKEYQRYLELYKEIEKWPKEKLINYVVNDMLEDEHYRYDDEFEEEYDEMFY